MLMKNFYFLFFIISSLSFGQVEIFNVAGGGALPTNWVGTNNIATNDIERTGYYLLDAGNPSDIIETDVYDLSAYASAEFKFDLATFSSGAANPALIEISFDGGTTYTQTATSTTPSSSSYISSGSINLNSLSNQVKIRISNSGSSGRGVRLQNLILVAYDSSPLITVSTNAISNLNYVEGGNSPEDTFTVEGSNLSNSIIITPPANFEISETSGAGYTSSSITLNGSSGTLAETTIYVRLQSGLTANAYSGNIDITSTDASPKSIAVSGNVFMAPTNSIKITGVYDAKNNSTPKGIELYVINDISDLSAFGIGSANNGGGSDGKEFTFPAVSVTAGTYLYVTSDLVGFNSFFDTSLSNYQSGAMGVNGDDAIELFENGVVIDTFGDINTDGTGTAWDYVDGWAYRNNGTGPDGATFNINNWTFSGPNNLDGVTNSESTKPFPTNSQVLSANTFKTLVFNIHPNPTNLGYVTLNLKNTTKTNISVFNVLGKLVLSKTLTNNTLDVSSLNSGVYLVKITQKKAIGTTKLVIP